MYRARNTAITATCGIVEQSKTKLLTAHIRQCLMKDHFQIRIQDYVFLEGGGFCEGNGDRLRSTAGGGGGSPGVPGSEAPRKLTGL